MSLLARILRPRGPAGTGAEATGLEAHDVAVQFGASRRSTASTSSSAGRDPRADRAQRRRQDHPGQRGHRFPAPDGGTVRLDGADITGGRRTAWPGRGSGALSSGCGSSRACSVLENLEAARVRRGHRQSRGAPSRAGCSSWSGSAPAGELGRAARTARSAGWASPARCACGPRSCCSTSPRPGSTRGERRAARPPRARPRPTSAAACW